MNELKKPEDLIWAQHAAEDLVARLGLLIAENSDELEELIGLADGIVAALEAHNSNEKLLSAKTNIVLMNKGL